VDPETALCRSQSAPGPGPSPWLAALDAAPADSPHGLRPGRRLQLALLVRPRLGLRAVSLAQSSVELELAWPAASPVAAEPVQPLLVVLVVAAVVRPAP